MVENHRLSLRSDFCTISFIFQKYGLKPQSPCIHIYLFFFRLLEEQDDGKDSLLNKGNRIGSFYDDNSLYLLSNVYIFVFNTSLTNGEMWNVFKEGYIFQNNFILKDWAITSLIFLGVKVTQENTFKGLTTHDLFGLNYAQNKTVKDILKNGEYYNIQFQYHTEGHLLL